MGDGGVALLSVGTQMHRVLLHQVLLQAGLAGVVQVLLAGGRILGLQSTNDRVLALIERRFAGLLHAEINQHLVVGRRPVGLNLGIVQTGAVHVGANLVEVRRLRELDVDQRAAAELNAQRNVVPEQHGEDSGDAEDQREGKEVPFLAQKVDVGVM